MPYSVTRIRDYKELLHHAVVSFPNQVLFQTDEEALTFRSFADLVRRAAGGMAHLPKGIVICNISRQKLFAIGYFAAILTGHVACLLPEGHGVPESMRGYPAIRDADVECWLSGEPLDFSALQPPLPEEPCTIAFSSGTSSAAKGVVLSQTNLLTDAQYGMMRHRYWFGERLVHMLPYWHLFGLVTELLAPLYAGVSVFLPKSSLYFFRALRTFRPHSLHIPPALADTLCAALVAAKDPRDVTGGSLEKIMCAGAPLSDQTSKTLLKFGILPCTAYGLTECSPCVSLTEETDIRIGTSGPPLDCVSVKIAQDGEILVCGPTVMLGYFEDAEATRARIRDGYLHTGDIGKLDEAGHLCILGRKSSMLVFSNGKKCIPEAIESMVNRMEGVAESLLSCDTSGVGSVPVLTVVTDLSGQQLMPRLDRMMREADLFPYKLILQRNPIARNSMGKVIRK